MYIKSIELKNFKRFQDKRIEFPNDITIIKGKNESGKSTAREALTAALFFDPTIANIPQYVKDYQSWHTDKLYQIILEFEANGESYILEKDFEAQKIFFKNEAGDILSHDFDEIIDKLHEFGGYSNKDIFGNLSVIQKEGMILEDKDKKKIVERLQDMVAGTSSRVSISELLKKLKNAHSQLVKGLDASRPVKNSGKIKLTKDKIKELESRLNAMKEELKKKEGAQIMFDKLEAQLKVLKDNKEILSREYEVNKIYFTAQQEIEKITKSLDSVLKDLNIYKALEEEKSKAIKELSNIKAVTDKDQDMLEDLSRDIKHNKAEVDRATARIKELKGHNLRKYYPSGRLTFIVSGVLILLGFLGLVSKLLFGFWFLLAIFAGYMFLSGRYSKAVGLNSLESDKKSRKKNIIEYQKAFKKILLDLGLDDLEHVREHNKNIHRMKEMVDVVEKQQTTLLRGKHLKQLDHERKELEKQLGVEQSRITDEQKTSPTTPRRQRELEKKLEDVKKELEKTNQSYLEANAKLKNIEISQEDLVEEEEKLAEANLQLSQFEKRVKIYEILSETLSEAQKRSLQKTRKALQDVMSEYIKQITSSKYSEVLLDDDFRIQVFSPEKKDYVEASVLSSGMIDQLYIVARFGFLRLFYNPAKVSDDKKVKNENSVQRPIMILDDPFINFDQERRENMHHLLEQLTKDFQIILFTATDTYDSWGTVVEI